MICPKCGREMVRVKTGTALLVNPPMYPMKWWCQCGYEEDAGTERILSEEEIRKNIQERVLNK
ncbi:MAG: hypothetical protein J7K15_02845 [Deltaproteobacteria bacterium]|nr:hypothetical protein [Deltaproteobacteria bacterium]